jgi:hypothetical protein
MTQKLFYLFLVNILYCAAHAQVIQNPIADAVQIDRANGSYQIGQTYFKWVVDLNHDGVNDVLISLKESADEIKQEEANISTFDPDFHGFTVYIGLKDGGYILEKDTNGDGVGVNISECYVGYIRQVKKYGIVTVETRTIDDPNEPQARHGVVRQQVYCYTLEGRHINRTNLTLLLDPDEKNPIYDEYLSDSKRTKVQLQEVTP